MEIRNPLVSRALNCGVPLMIDIGCGEAPRPGFFGMDRRPLSGVDIVGDLEAPLTLLPDRSVEEVRAHHVLEHVVNLDGLMSELHRVLAPGGQLQVTVPHAANPFGWSDPTHVRLFGLYSFAYFSPLDQQPLSRKVPCYRRDRLFRIERLQLGFRPRTRVGRSLQRWLNDRTGRLEWWERNGSTLRWPYEVECTLRPL